VRFARLKRYLPWGKPRFYRRSYAQSGEDVILDYLLNWIGVAKPSYLDIGAHHPKHLSNTFFFYQKGCHGVVVEPDPILYALIKKVRNRDICLHCGVGGEDQEDAEFYVMNPQTLNTFSRKEMEEFVASGKYSLQETLRIPMLSVNTIIERYFDSAPDILSLDVEGLDWQILQSLDFTRFRPRTVCVETVTHIQQTKIQEILDWMCDRGYTVYADTFINTIFVERQAWAGRRRG